MKMLRSRRKECGMTMKELGKKVGVSEAAISLYESGKRQAPYETQLKLAEALDCTIDYLLRGSEDKTAASTGTPALTAKDERDIAHKLNEVLDQLSGDSALMFDGEPLDDVTRDLLRDSLENQFRTAKVLAKQKYTPKKYRKEE